MGLQEKLDGISRDFAAQADPAIVKEIKKAVEHLANSGIMDRVLKAGDQAPEFSLEDAEGREVSLVDLLRNGPVVLTFYRGLWCPFCNAELDALQGVHDEIRDTGATLVAISPQKAKYSRQLAQKHQLTFPMLSDPGNELARRFGLVWTMPGELREIYKQFSLDVPRFNSDDSWSLPIPARYIVKQDGTIFDTDAHPDYTRRPEPRQTLEKLRRLMDG